MLQQIKIQKQILYVKFPFEGLATKALHSFFLVFFTTACTVQDLFLHMYKFVGHSHFSLFFFCILCVLQILNQQGLIKDQSRKRLSNGCFFFVFFFTLFAQLLAYTNQLYVNATHECFCINSPPKKIICVQYRRSVKIHDFLT